MDLKLRVLVEEKFTPPEVARIVEFIGDGRFSPNGEMAICSVLFAARERGKELQKVLEALSDEWSKNWKYQRPEIKADPDAIGEAGVNNQASIENIYKVLGIYVSAIPAGKFTVKTANSTYDFGPADKTGKRTVTKNGKPLLHEYCRVLVLSRCESMVLDWIDSVDEGQWTSTKVLDIIVH